MVWVDGDLINFARRYAFHDDERIVRSCLMGLCQTRDSELSTLQVILDELIGRSMHMKNSSVRRLTLSLIWRLEMSAERVRADFLDFSLEHLVSVSEPSGLQSVCMKLAFRMCQYPPRTHERAEARARSHGCRYYQPAVKSVRNKILSSRFR